MDNQHPDAVQTVSVALAATRWLSVPCPPEYLPALARDVLYALEQAEFEVVALPNGRHYPLPPASTMFSHGVSAEAGRVLDGNQPMSPLDAREYAAVLLAAANAAESVAVAASREEQ